ncbi:MAG: 2'-5' RNA ligase family protein, partial [Actinomycetota bacterium]|nr:2'-5' RNA ligase family protein [Actinomycetota bacterium]
MGNNNKSVKRLFLAVDIPEFIKNEIYEFTSGLFNRDKNIRVLHALNIHITLKFLGNVDISRIGKIEEASMLAAGKLDKFEYKLGGNIGAFPSSSKAGVIFVGIGT